MAKKNILILIYQFEYRLRFLLGILKWALFYLFSFRHQLKGSMMLVPQLLARKYMYEAQTALSSDRLEVALKYVNSALYIEPRNMEFLRCKNEILQHKGEFQEAFDCLYAIFQKTHYHAWLILDLADLSINHIKKPADALVWLRRLYETTPLQNDDLRRYYRLSVEALIDLDRLSEAHHLLFNILKFFPNDMNFLFQLGWISLQMSNYELAVAVFQKVIHRDPYHSEAQYYLGVSYEGLQQFDKMLVCFERTYLLDASMPPILNFSKSQLFELTTQVLSEFAIPSSLHFGISILDYPDKTILQEMPHDPRIMGKITQLHTLRPVGQPLQFVFTLFRWNLERFSHTTQAIRDEIRIILQQELSQLPEMYEQFSVTSAYSYQ